MKLLGILWNSMDSKKDEALEYIKKFGNVIYWDIDLGEDYKAFLTELYPFNESEKWKADYKINGLVYRYDTNRIRILIIDLKEDEKVYLKNKDKMMYKNVLELKVSLRKKYDYLVKENTMSGVKKYDNVFHMTDDQKEYEKDLKIIIKYLRKNFERKNGFMKIDGFVDEDTCQTEQWGTRPKLWINRNILFKENTQNTFECYSELFNMYLMKLCGLNPAYYDLANYKGKDGVITINILNDNEFMIDGSHIMSEDESYTKKELIEHNNLEMLESIIKTWCNDKGYIYNDAIMLDLNNLFIYDLLTLQPDRNPSNYAVAVNKETLKTRLVYFDNSNMLFCDKPEIIDLYSKGKIDLEKERGSLKTFLLFKKEDTCFDRKEDLFKSYYECADLERRAYIKNILGMMSSENLIQIFNSIENERHFKLPNEFKRMIIGTYNSYHLVLNEIINQIDEKDKSHIKVLQYKSNCNKMVQE